jgi:UDP-N-acetylmuramoylalanine--D-glutamate ligase
MLAASRGKVLVGGNIGQPLVGRLPELGADWIVVMELSSFQLETVDRSPWLSAITNITPNHLDRHKTMAAYTAAKERIFRFQKPTEWTVLNADDPVSQELRPPGRVARFSLESPVAGAFLKNDALHLDAAGRQEDVCPIDAIRLRGRHNLANALTACLTSALAGASTQAMRDVLRRFRGLPHRLQSVGERDGVGYYDDSIATSPERSMAALAAFKEPVILLAGGRDKDLPMDDWARMIRTRVEHVVLFGEASNLIRSALARASYPADRIAQVDSIPAAVKAASDVARAGQVVLLSPGCTSYDMFRDFEQRGDAFAAAVRELIDRDR